MSTQIIAKRSREKRKPKSLSKLERGSSINAAFEQLRELIVLGHLAPGSWIVEVDLARRLDLSRTPVRGALQWLQREGYVIEHKNGTKSRMRVAPLTQEDAHELYIIVGQMEALAGVLTSSLSPEKRANLVKVLISLNEQLRKIASAAQIDPRRVFDLDTTFHYKIVEASAGPRLLTLHRSVKPQIERYWRLYASSIINDLHLTVAEHEAIIEAIKKGSAKGVERSLQNNWQKGAERIERLIVLFGERGSW